MADPIKGVVASRSLCFFSANAFQPPILVVGEPALEFARKLCYKLAPRCDMGGPLLNCDSVIFRKLEALRFILILTEIPGF